MHGGPRVTKLHRRQRLPTLGDLSGIAIPGSNDGAAEASLNPPAGPGAAATGSRTPLAVDRPALPEMQTGSATASLSSPSTAPTAESRITGADTHFLEIDDICTRTCLGASIARSCVSDTCICASISELTAVSQCVQANCRNREQRGFLQVVSQSCGLEVAAALLAASPISSSISSTTLLSSSTSSLTSTDVSSSITSSSPTTSTSASTSSTTSESTTEQPSVIFETITPNAIPSKRPASNAATDVSVEAGNESESSGLSKPAVVGIIAGVVAGLMLIAICIWVIRKQLLGRNHRRQEMLRQSQNVDEWTSKEKEADYAGGSGGQAGLGSAVDFRLSNQRAHADSTGAVADPQFWEQFRRANDSYELPNETNRYPIRHQSLGSAMDQYQYVEQEQIASPFAFPQRRDSLPMQAQQANQSMPSGVSRQLRFADTPPSSSPPRTGSNLSSQPLRPPSDHAEPVSARSSITFDGLAYLVPEHNGDSRVRNSFIPRAM